MAEPAALISQIAFLVRDDAHFRSLLNSCDPAERRNMYEALRPNLRFAPRALDVYLAEIAIDAEARQLPVMGEGGKLREFRAPEVRTKDAEALETAWNDQKIAQSAVREVIAKEHLLLVCRKCTKEAVFDGMRRADCVAGARAVGWVYEGERGGAELCPDCGPPVMTSAEYRLVCEFKQQTPKTIAWFMDVSAGTPAELDAAALDAARVWLSAGRPDIKQDWSDTAI